MKKFKYIIIILALALTSCSEPNIKYLKTQTPKLILKDFFRNTIIASGLVQNWRGEVTKTFTANVNAHWDDNNCTMTQKINFNNGSTLNRKIGITIAPDGKLTLNALDIDGLGAGLQSGNVASFSYDLLVPYMKGEISLSTSEWLYMLPDNSVMADITFRKFGIKVGKVIIHMKKS